LALASAYFGVAVIYEKQNDYPQVLANLNKTIQFGPQDAKSYKFLGDYYYNQNYLNCFLDYSLAYYTLAILKNPEFKDAYVSRGLVFFIDGDTAQSLADYNKAISIDPNDAEAYKGRASIYMKQGNFPEAIADLTKAIEINPKYGEAYEKRGDFYFDQGDYAKAISDFSKDIEIGTPHIWVYTKRGKGYEKLGKFAQAIADFNKVLAIKPKYRSVPMALFTSETSLMEDLIKKGILKKESSTEVCLNQNVDEFTRPKELEGSKFDFIWVGLQPHYASDVFYNRALAYDALKNYDNAWKDVHKAESLNGRLDPKFLDKLKKDSGRDE